MFPLMLIDPFTMIQPEKVPLTKGLPLMLSDAKSEGFWRLWFVGISVPLTVSMKTIPSFTLLDELNPTLPEYVGLPAAVPFGYPGPK